MVFNNSLMKRYYKFYTNPPRSIYTEVDIGIDTELHIYLYGTHTHNYAIVHQKSLFIPLGTIFKREN